MASGSGWNLWVWLAGGGCRMKVCTNVLYTNKHIQTNASYPAMDISCMPSRGGCKS